MRYVFLLMLLITRLGQPNAFEDVDIQGHCSKRNTQILENGDALAILFNDFGIEMPAGSEGDGRNAHRECVFQVRIASPKNQYLTSLQQTFSGGILKSKDAVGLLKLVFNVDERVRMPGLKWEKGIEISPESPESAFVHKVEDILDEPVSCSKKTQYRVRVILDASRKNLREHFVGGLDSLDSELTQKLELRPKWKICSAKKSKN